MKIGAKSPIYLIFINRRKGKGYLIEKGGEFYRVGEGRRGNSAKNLRGSEAIQTSPPLTDTSCKRIFYFLALIHLRIEEGIEQELKGTVGLSTMLTA